MRLRFAILWITLLCESAFAQERTLVWFQRVEFSADDRGCYSRALAEADHANGRLSQNVDPVGRMTKLKYWSTDSCDEPSSDRTNPCTYQTPAAPSASVPVRRRQRTQRVSSKVWQIGRLQYDGLDRLRSTNDGGYASTIDLDEAGNVTHVEPPAGVGKVTATFDARGLPLTEQKSGGTITRQYDALGNLRVYRDEAGKETQYTTDDLGRVTGIDYPDSTSERVEYDAAGQVKAQRDRAGKWFSYLYDTGGRVLSVHNAQTASDTNRIVVYEYDQAKRLFRVTSKDGEIEYTDYDLLGRPRHTTTTRFKNESGLKPPPAQEWLDRHTQTHAWSIYDGERTAWTMPVVGDPSAVSNAAPWRTTIEEQRNGSENLVWQHDPSGASISSATAASIGRITERSRSLAGGPLTTSYAFADTSLPADYTSPQQKKTGALRSASTAFGSPSVPRAGSEIYFGASSRIGDSVDLGLIDRVSSWTYDGRGRLKTTRLLQPKDQVGSVSPITDQHRQADFREARDLTTAFGPVEHTKIGAEQSLIVEPLPWTADENGAHAVAKRSVSLDATVATKIFTNEFGRRKSNGEWTYEYDELHRVTAKENGARRIEYSYDPNSRVVGRLARSGSPGAWVDDSAALSRDGIPARTTWVWDPISDRLVAMYAEGASMGTGAGPDAGLLRQYVHGDRGYDDPLEVLTTSTPGGSVSTYYPVFDEAGSGSLQAIIGADGNLVERVLYGDSYGDAPRYLQGPVVDKVTFASKKNPITGKIEQVDVRLHVSEPLRASTAAGGARLAAVKADGSVALTAAQPELEGKSTLHWELDAGEWEALVTASGSQSLEVAINATLRAEGWGEQLIQRVPDWAPKVFAGVTYDAMRPVIVTRGLANLDTLSGDATPVPLYEIKNLYMAASMTSKARLLTDFHGYPFREPADGTIFVRARWYDPATGAFLTPDPMGYADSSNAYAIAANDPVNGIDPSGEMSIWEELGEDGRKEFRGFLSGSIGTLPVAGEITDAVQAATGYDFIAGEKLAPWERGVAAGSLLVPFAGSRVLRKSAGAVVDVERGAEGIADGARGLPTSGSFPGDGSGNFPGGSGGIPSSGGGASGLPNPMEKYHSLEYVERVMNRAAKMSLSRSLSSGATGARAGHQAERIFETYALKMQLRLMQAGSLYRVTIQPAAMADTGVRVLARTKGSFKGARRKGAQILDYGIYATGDGGANYARILSGGDMTVTLGGGARAAVEYAPAFPGARLFGVDPTGIYP